MLAYDYDFFVSASPTHHSGGDHDVGLFVGRSLRNDEGAWNGAVGAGGSRSGEVISQGIVMV